MSRRIESRFRRRVTAFPVPDSLPLLARLEQHELRAMGGQPPVVWDRAEGFQVWDRWGNCWLDWSSGVLVANAGHGRAEIRDAIAAQAGRRLLTNYCFPSEIRAELCERLAGLLPEPLKKIFLLTTGGETIEFAIKASRAFGLHAGGVRKRVVVSYENAFHGRTLGAQQAGGIPALKEWIGHDDGSFVQAPFPDGFWCQDTSFEAFERTLDECGIAGGDVCAVIMESYQGGTAAMAPLDYLSALRAWCDRHGALLVFDEVQAGFGRCGTMFGFEQLGVMPDLITLGKGISSSLPLSAVAGRADVMDLLAPGTASSTHSGNPVCCAAALANLDLIAGERLAENAARVGAVLQERLRALHRRFRYIGFHAGQGLVAGLACVHRGTHEPDAALAKDVVWRAVDQGLLLFAPVGPGGSTIKICPPLCITAEAVEEGCDVLADCFEEAIEARQGNA
jgi:4-aminobutyrate aminotransferase/diaminobutyrate-pyruvate transaminase/4-aminobutyrate aminotransferase/(S)-3-amino-2-methylpropionate transaminase